MVLVACRPGPAATVEPVLQPVDNVPLARRLVVSSAVPTQLSVHAQAEDQGFRVVFPTFATDHAVPLLGLKPNRSYTVDVTLDDERGRSRLAGSLVVETGPLPTDFPVIDVLAHDPDRVEPGYVLATVRRVGEGGSHRIVAFDAIDLEVAWFVEQDNNFGDVGRTSEGTLLGLRIIPEEVDFLNAPVARWVPEPELDHDRPLPVDSVHHELHPYPDGTMLSLSNGVHSSAAYPSSVDDPTTLDQATDLVTSRVIRLDREGALLWDVDLTPLLDDSRIGMSSLEPLRGGLDWLHVNGAVPHPSGGAVVSLRHQDALIALDEAGEPRWLLGDPAGWQSPQSDWLLEPVGDLQWPYHPHAPAFDADGLMVVFDNHNFGHTPYTEPPDEPWRSRVVAYRIDEDAGTVEQAWSFVPGGGPVQSPRMGDADPLPVTGHVLANFGWIQTGPDDAIEDVRMRLIQLDPDALDDPALDLQLTAPMDGGLPGVRSYRSDAIPSLYADDVVFEPVW